MLTARRLRTAGKFAVAALVVFAVFAQADPDHRWTQPTDAERHVWNGTSPESRSWRYGVNDSASTQTDPAYSGYRFRDQPTDGQGNWQSSPDAGRYRFRPLSEGERSNDSQAPSWRPLN